MYRQRNWDWTVLIKALKRLPILQLQLPTLHETINSVLDQFSKTQWMRYGKKNLERRVCTPFVVVKGLTFSTAVSARVWHLAGLLSFLTQHVRSFTSGCSAVVRHCATHTLYYANRVGSFSDVSTSWSSPLGGYEQSTDDPENPNLASDLAKLAQQRWQRHERQKRLAGWHARRCLFCIVGRRVAGNRNRFSTAWFEVDLERALA